MTRTEPAAFVVDLGPGPSDHLPCGHCGSRRHLSWRCPIYLAVQSMEADHDG